jgi:glycosyltransferase involved in cell wall biosynthesis
LEVDFLGVGVPEEDVLADFDVDLHPRVRAVASYRREDLPRLLAAHEIKLFPTLTEGYGIALLEAMACGLAPVSSDAPGPSEIIDDGRDGLLAPAGDDAALEAQLERLLTDAELRQRIRTSAHATAQGWSWSRIAEETTALYERVRWSRASSSTAS